MYSIVSLACALDSSTACKNLHKMLPLYLILSKFRFDFPQKFLSAKIFIIYSNSLQPGLSICNANVAVIV